MAAFTFPLLHKQSHSGFHHRCSNQVAIAMVTIGVVVIFIVWLDLVIGVFDLST